MCKKVLRTKLFHKLPALASFMNSSYHSLSSVLAQALYNFVTQFWDKEMYVTIRHFDSPVRLLKEKDCFLKIQEDNSSEVCPWQYVEVHFMQILTNIWIIMKDLCNTLCNQPLSCFVCLFVYLFFFFFFPNLRNPQVFKRCWSTGFQLPPPPSKFLSVKWLHHCSFISQHWALL